MSGWTLVAAVAVIAVVILVALWLTGSEKVAVIVTVPLLVAIGAITIRKL